MATGRLAELGEARREQILEFIASQTRTRGISPSLQEIAAHLGIAYSAVHRHVRILIEQKKLTRAGGPGSVRTLVPTSRRKS